MNQEQLLEKLWREELVEELCELIFDTKVTENQALIIREIAFGKAHRVVITCMTRYGKSWAVSQALLLWILRNPNKRLALVAPTNDKTSIIRNYIVSFVIRSPLLMHLIDLDKTGADRIKKEVSKRRMTWKNNVEMRTLTAEGQGEALMGFGADLVVIDETCDIDYEVWRSKISRMLGDSMDSRCVEIGNPWHRDNHMYQHWLDPKWLHIHVGFNEALNEGRISASFLAEQKEQLTDREFQVLYAAEFPEEAEDSLIRYEWIKRAQDRGSIQPEYQIVAGADIAEQGNDLTCVTIAKWNKANDEYEVIDIQSWGKTDTMPTVGKIVPILEKYGVKRIKVDASGIGAGVCSRLDELRREGKIKCEVVSYKGGQAPFTTRSKERFLNVKAESYWRLRDLFEKGKIKILKNASLINQLSKMKWETTSSMKIRIRDPGEKEGDTSEQKSPDFADSLNYMVWEGGTPKLVYANISLNK